MDWLEYLQFATEVPLGQVIFFGGCLLALVVCGLLFVMGLRLRKRLLTIPSALIALAVTAIIAANIAFPLLLESDPLISDSAVVGYWVDDDGSYLDLGADHSARFHFGWRYNDRVPLAEGQGTWQKSADFDIPVTATKAPKAHIPPLGLIIFNARPHLILDDYGDPDGWDRHLGFHRAAHP